jgi:uncharacterized protein YdcH (DUF465 family)
MKYQEVCVSDEEIAKVLEVENEEYKGLHGEHQKLKTQLATMKGKVYLTPEEETEVKQLQKLKLAKKDRMAEIIREQK